MKLKPYQELTNAQIKKAHALQKMVKKKIDTSEYRTATVKGVKNLSRADLDQIDDVCDTIHHTNQWPYLILSTDVIDVFEKALL